MRMMKLVVPVAVAFVGLMLCTSATYGKPEYAKKEGQKCQFCHTKMGSKEVMEKSLTEAGQYYKAHNHSLDGYKK